MSAQPESGGFVFQSASADHGRARAVTACEFAQLAEALSSEVMPLLQAAADSLAQKPLISAGARQGPGWAELTAFWSDYILEGRLRVEIHKSFAPLVPRKPVYCVYSIHRGRTLKLARELVACESERLTGFDDLSPVRDALNAFTSVFLTVVPR